MKPSVVSVSELTYAEWFALWFDYVQPHLSDPELPLHQKTYQRLVSPSSPLQGIAVRLDEPCALAHFYFHPSTWAESEVCYLQDLYVAPSARGRGVARLLIEAVAIVAKQNGAPFLHWRVRETNHQAIELYERVGKRTDRLCYSVALN